MAPVFILFLKTIFDLLSTLLNEESCKWQIVSEYHKILIEYNTVISIHCGVYKIYKPSAQALSSVQAKQGHYSPGPSGL